MLASKRRDFLGTSSQPMVSQWATGLVSKECGGKEGTASRQYPDMFVATGTIVAKHYVNAEGENFMPRYLPKTSSSGGWQ